LPLNSLRTLLASYLLCQALHCQLFAALGVL
jgi:hypothetical protein